jgi:uncharacterized membrane protein YdjX (TVP38/TMEM64 family)
VNHKLLRWLLLLLIGTGIALAVVYRDHFDAQALTLWVDQAGSAGPLLFMAIYAVATVLFLPGSVLTLAGGALFGPVLGTFYNLTGATVGATLAFLVARYLASDWVEKKTAGRLQQLKQGVEKEGWRFVAFVRLVPLFPFNLLNYALGLTRLKFSHYVIASYVFMLPGAFAYTYLGYAGREAIAGGEAVVQKGLLALGLLAMVAFLPRLVSYFRQDESLSLEALKKQLDSNTGLLLLDVRSTGDFNGKLGHVSTALNIPLEDLAQHMGDLSAYRNKPVALICTTDRKSKKAARLLNRAGFSDVKVVTGGMTQWNQYNWPIEHDSPH